MSNPSTIGDQYFPAPYFSALKFRYFVLVFTFGNNSQGQCGRAVIEDEKATPIQQKKNKGDSESPMS